MSDLLDIPNIRDIRLATKGLMGIPQHFLQDDVLAGYERWPRRPGSATWTSPSTRTSTTRSRSRRSSAKACARLLDMGFRDVRNQGVLLRGVNTTPQALLELCFMLIDHGEGPPVLLLHVRHDPQLRALADVAWPRPRSSSTPSSATCPGSLRRAIVCDVPVRRQALGAPGRRTTTGAWASRTGPRTTERGSSSTTPTPSPRVPVLRPDLHASPRRARSTGGSTCGKAAASSSRSRPQVPGPGSS